MSRNISVVRKYIVISAVLSGASETTKATRQYMELKKGYPLLIVEYFCYHTPGTTPSDILDCMYVKRNYGA